MEKNDFTSGPVRDLAAEELGSSVFTDFELLSDSGHNLVYRAMMDGKWVVLKAAKKDEGAATRNQLLLRREYDIMREADSIYVVRMWQMVDLPDLGPSIVMEYVHGRTFAQFMEENPSSSLRIQVANELLEALLSLHDRQIIHGDLKSSNILITENGNHVRLIDFGFADTDAYVAKNIGSSPSIQSPDMPMQESAQTADVQRDIYAFGKVLELLFPHRYGAIRRKCLSHGYQSVLQIKKAFTRCRLLSFILPMVCLLAMIVVLAIAGTKSVIEHNMPAPQVDTVLITNTIVQRDTIVIAPQVDSLWLKIESQAERRYAQLYRTYKDSITNMPQKNMLVASEMSTRYAASMLATRDKLIAAHPEYERDLHDQYLHIYSRDYSKICKLYADYPVILP